VSGSIEILCPVCGRESLLRRELIYDGFTKTGERLLCADCGHVFASEADVPFLCASKPAVFSDEDHPEAVKVFAEDEQRRCCRHCKHYVVNPFLQWCGRHRREVEATDLCDDFDARR